MGREVLECEECVEYRGMSLRLVPLSGAHLVVAILDANHHVRLATHPLTSTNSSQAHPRALFLFGVRLYTPRPLHQAPRRGVLAVEE